MVGDVLTTGNGSWNGTPTIGFTYQWMHCDTSGMACASIPTAIGSTYVVLASDIGTTIECVVTATNWGGSATVTTLITAAAVAAVAPSVVSQPTASSAEPTVGVGYYASTGTWGCTLDITYAYQWFDLHAGRSRYRPVHAGPDNCHQLGWRQYSAVQSGDHSRLKFETGQKVGRACCSRGCPLSVEWVGMVDWPSPAGTTR